MSAEGVEAAAGPPAAPLAVLGGTVLDPLTGQGRRADLLLAGGRVARLVGPGELDLADGVTGLDATGLLVAPGLLDLQVNGAAGIDVTATPELLWHVAAALPRHGVTSFLPTLVTSGEETRRRALDTLRAGRPDGVPAGARPLGLHIEGPMLSPERSGAHDRDLLRLPDHRMVAGWSAAAGVAMVTLAPELPGALEVIRQLTARRVVVSIGHTAATLAQVDAAVAAGARAVTHLYNAMPGLGHREPGPVGAVLGGDTLVAGVIVDGHHVHQRTVAATWRAIGPERFWAVSDTTAALDQPPGQSILGGKAVRISGGVVRLADDSGTLAGSAAGLDDCVRLLARFTGAAPAVALASATAVPAGLVGRADLGRLRVGGPADVALFTPSLHTVATIIAGAVVHHRDAAAEPLTAGGS